MTPFGFHYDGAVPRQGLSPLIDTGPITKVGPLSIAGSLRLTNQAALCDCLALPFNSDWAAVLAKGWRAWGLGLADRLRGDFVFAIADQSLGSLYVARDPLGVAPCYFLEDGSVLRCADSSVRLRRAIAKPLDVDRTPLLLFLENRAWGHARTFFQGVERLPPGHYLELKSADVTITRYWSATAVPRRTDTTCATDEFGALLEASVMRAYVPGRTGLLLSGGLDSSAIAGVLADRLGPDGDLATVTMSYHDTPGWNDRRHIRSLRDAYNFSFHDLPSDEQDPLADVDFYLRTLDGPWFPYGQSVSFRAKRWLLDQGRDIIVTGHGGDEIVSHGLGRLNELARSGRWLRLARESRAGAALHDTSHLQAFLIYTDHIALIRRMRAKLRRLGLERKTEAASILSSEARRDLADCAPADPPAALTRPDHDDRMVQEDALTSPLYAKAFENIALSSRALGLETRMPFCDRDLVELSLSLPSSTKLDGGWTRRILREAMRGRVPESVLRRKDKFDFGGNFIRGLLTQRERLLDETAQSNSRLREMLNDEELERLRAPLLPDGPMLERTDAYALWRVAVTARWLDIEREGPVLPRSPALLQ